GTASNGRIPCSPCGHTGKDRSIAGVAAGTRRRFENGCSCRPKAAGLIESEFARCRSSCPSFLRQRRAYAIPNFFYTCAGSKRNVTVSRLVQCAPDGRRLRHVETLFKKLTSE